MGCRVTLAINKFPLEKPRKLGLKLEIGTTVKADVEWES
jgi:hypothetical protein